MPVSEARGFAISDGPVRTIAINNKDTPNARVFSLTHELVHVALRETGLCDLNDEAPRPAHDLDVEVFCYRVAGEVLVPADALLSEPEVRASGGPEHWTDATIRSLASRYGVSRDVVVRRLLILELTTPRFYEQKRIQYDEEYKAWKENRRPGFALPFRKSLRNVGPTYGALVHDRYRQRLVTASDVSSFLDLKLKHLEKFQSALGDALAAGMRS